MIVTKYVIHRGKKKLVSELSKSSSHKVDVQCPVCGKIRRVHYRSIVTAGHDICQACIMARRAIRLHVGKRYGRLIIIGWRNNGKSICECD